MIQLIEVAKLYPVVSNIVTYVLTFGPLSTKATRVKEVIMSLTLNY